MFAVCGLLLALAWGVWREPLELAQSRRGTVQDLESFVARHPDSTPGALALAEAHLRRGQAAEAVRVLRPRLQAQPQNPDLHGLAIQAYLGLGNLNAAQAHTDLLDRLEPRNPDLPTLRASLMLARGESEAAEPAFRAILTQRPNDVGALAGLAELTAQQGLLTEAERHYARAAKVRPSVRVLARLAEVRFRLGRADAAIAASRAALAIAPEDRAGNLWLGRALYARDPQAHAREAEAALRRGAGGGGDASIPRYYLGQLLREQNRVLEAVELLEANVAANDLDKASHSELLLCYRILGKEAESERLLRRLEVLNRLDLVGSELEYRVWAEPENVTARFQLAQTYLRHERPDLAAPELREVLKRDPSHSEAQRLLASLAPRDDS